MIKKNSIVIFMFIFMNFHSVSLSAIPLEEQDNPTSFTVKILPWKQANEIIPNKKIFTIIDVETGLTFNVQRRAGNKHADVQPLTHGDTKIMKSIYNGNWSWKRRAIIILTEDRLLAASMHGMPHGAGALNNGFSGHFCVHFFGSTTHGSKNEDLSHKLMILRAGGKVEEYLSELTPDQVVKVLEAAINQGDSKIINMIIVNGDNQKRLNQKMQNILGVKFIDKFRLQYNQNQPLFQKLIVSAIVYKVDNRKEEKDIEFILLKDMISNRWFIDGNFINEIN